MRSLALAGVLVFLATACGDASTVRGAVSVNPRSRSTLHVVTTGRTTLELENGDVPVDVLARDGVETSRARLAPHASSRGAFSRDRTLVFYNTSDRAARIRFAASSPDGVVVRLEQD